MSIKSTTAIDIAKIREECEGYLPVGLDRVHSAILEVWHDSFALGALGLDSPLRKPNDCRLKMHLWSDNTGMPQFIIFADDADGRLLAKFKVEDLIEDVGSDPDTKKEMREMVKVFRKIADAAEAAIEKCEYEE